MGKCLSASGAGHGRAISFSEREPHLGESINNENKIQSPQDEKNSIKYTDASHIYNSTAHGDKSKNIEKFLKLDYKNNLRVKKCLLLGAGSTGKSTLFRQLKCIHGAGFDMGELIESKNVIRSNCVLGILTLLKKSQELFDRDNELYAACYINLQQDDALVTHIRHVLSYSLDTFEEAPSAEEDSKLSDLAHSIELLWSLAQIKYTFSLRQHYSIIENMDYFLDQASRIFTSQFEPSHEDHLKCRIRTTGLIEANYMINDVAFHIFDVGGQRNERKKWIQLFEGVTAVIFVAALNHYCSVLFEDEHKNAMMESLQLFEEICNCKWFKRTEMILFLNKNDLFRQRIKQRISLNVFFNPDTYKPLNKEYYQEYPGPEYEPHPDSEQDEKNLDSAHSSAAEFIRAQYEMRNHTQQTKRIFVHITTATDQKNVEKVFWDVQSMVVNSNLRKGGLV